MKNLTFFWGHHKSNRTIKLYLCIGLETSGFCIVVKVFKGGSHIVPCEKFHRIGGAPPETFPNVKFDAPEEVVGDRKCY